MVPERKGGIKAAKLSPEERRRIAKKRRRQGESGNGGHHHKIMILYEWVAARGLARDGALTSFRAKLAPGLRPHLDRATLLLETVDSTDVVPNMIVGPIRARGTTYRHIYKLRLGRKVRLRPLLCKGPMLTDDKDLVWTFLIGATERDGKFSPAKAPAKAEARREDLTKSDAQRRRYETPPKESTD